jgi:hypothetical protein
MSTNLSDSTFSLDASCRDWFIRVRVRARPYGATVTLALSSGALNGVATATTNSSGVAVFSNLSVPTAGSYTLSASSSGVLSASSSSFTISDSTMPTVAAARPSTSDVHGGETVILTGTNFLGATAVFFGSSPASSFTVDSNTQITAVVPAEAAGTTDIRVTTPQGTSAISVGDPLTYVASVTFVVMNTNSSGPGSLYAAVNSADQATSPAFITFNPSVFDVPQTITLTASLMLENASQPITIAGPTAAPLTISGNSQAGVLIATNGVTATVENLTFTQGNAGNGAGGGICVSNGTVTIDNCTITDSAALSGGGISVAGGTVLVVDSTVSGNTAEGGYGGGIICFGTGYLTVLDSTIAGNTSVNVPGLGAGGGGVAAFGGNVTVVDCTIEGNSVTNPGPTNGAGGGGFASTRSGTMTIVGSSIVGNSVSGFSSSGGGGQTNFDGNVSIVNSILWNDTAPTSPDFAYGGNGTHATNFTVVGNTSGADLPSTAVDNIVGVSTSPAILANLASNGGPTQTMAPPPRDRNPPCPGTSRW